MLAVRTVAATGPRALLGTLGLVAFLVMHAATFPAGHLAFGAAPLAQPSSAATPGDGGQPTGATGHEGAGMSHEGMAEGCAVILVGGITVTVAVLMAFRRRRRPLLAFSTWLAPPDPPVPRLGIAH